MKASSNPWHQLQCATDEDCVIACADHIAQSITRVLQQQDRISLFVSGGKSPAPVFSRLSTMALPWKRVDIFLVDERWAPDDSDDRNETLVKLCLLQANARSATFHPLYAEGELTQTIDSLNLQTQAIAYPDIVMLGMGLDGHTASLFPDSDDYPAAMESTDHFVVVQPKSAPYTRISMSFHWIKSAQEIIFFLPGMDKQAALTQFLADRTQASPVVSLLDAIPERINLFTSGGAIP